MTPQQVLKYLAYNLLSTLSGSDVGTWNERADYDDSTTLNMITSHYEFKQGDLKDLELFLAYHPNQYPIVFIDSQEDMSIKALAYPPLKKSFFDYLFPIGLPHYFDTFPRHDTNEVRGSRYQGYRKVQNRTNLNLLTEPPRVSTVGLWAKRRDSKLLKNNIQVYRDTDGETGLEIIFQTLALQGTVGNYLFNELTYMDVQEYFENPAKQEEFAEWNNYEITTQDHFIRLKYQPHNIKTLNYPPR